MPRYPMRSLGKGEPVTIAQIRNGYRSTLNHALFLPSRIDGISLTVEFIYNWFINKFGGEENERCYFKTVNLDGRDPFLSMKRWNVKDWIKRQKPKLTIIHKTDLSYNRDFLDDDYNTLIGYINRRRDNMEDFFHDYENNVHLGLVSRLNLINFSFKMVVGTLPQQYDLYDHLLMACRVGKTLTLYANVDFAVPQNLIKALCRDLNFKQNADGFPADPIKFLEYMNAHSHLTFLYKFRGINRKMEFFVRIDHLMVNLREIEMDYDEGETEGMLKTNYGVEMRMEVRMPAPKFFTYRSVYEFNELVIREPQSDGLLATDLVTNPIAPVNSNHWNILLDGKFESEKANEVVDISLYDMFGRKDPSENKINHILETIDYCITRGLSPEVFMEIKLYNNRKERPIYINWEKMMLHTREALPSKVSTIVVYTDNNFIHNAISELYEYKKNRIIVEDENQRRH